MEFRHMPVMLNECIEALDIKPDGIYADCTVGGAGHSIEIVKRLGEKGRLIAVDKDEEAILAASERLREYKDRTTFIHDDFKNLAGDLKELNVSGLSGILIDLGVSSYQLDNAERGFSYMKDAPLDMRMDRGQYLTAFNVVNEFSAGELARILFEYGEEKLSRRIAENIVSARQTKTISTTLQLAEIVEKSYPAATRFKFGHPAKRTFQAIRIAVNDELTDLKECIKALAGTLKTEGRMAVVSFHSLEDRIVKTAFKELTQDCICPPDFPICVCNNKRVAKLVNKKPICPSERELEENSRSASAKLRVIEKI